MIGPKIFPIKDVAGEHLPENSEVRDVMEQSCEPLNKPIYRQGILEGEHFPPSDNGEINAAPATTTDLNNDQTVGNEKITVKRRRSSSSAPESKRRKLDEQTRLDAECAQISAAAGGLAQTEFVKQEETTDPAPGLLTANGLMSLGLSANDVALLLPVLNQLSSPSVEVTPPPPISFPSPPSRSRRRARRNNCGIDNLMLMQASDDSADVKEEEDDGDCDDELWHPSGVSRTNTTAKNSDNVGHRAGQSGAEKRDEKNPAYGGLSEFYALPPLDSVYDLRPHAEGSWAKDEVVRLLDGLLAHGRKWRVVTHVVGTRSCSQVRQKGLGVMAKLVRHHDLRIGSITSRSSNEVHPRLQVVIAEQRNRLVNSKDDINMSNDFWLTLDGRTRNGRATSTSQEISTSVKAATAVQETSVRSCEYPEVKDVEDASKRSTTHLSSLPAAVGAEEGKAAVAAAEPIPQYNTGTACTSGNKSSKNCSYTVCHPFPARSHAGISTQDVNPETAISNAELHLSGVDICEQHDEAGGSGLTTTTSAGTTVATDILMDARLENSGSAAETTPRIDGKSEIYHFLKQVSLAAPTFGDTPPPATATATASAARLMAPLPPLVSLQDPVFATSISNFPEAFGERKFEDCSGDAQAFKQSLLNEVTETGISSSASPVRNPAESFDSCLPFMTEASGVLSSSFSLTPDDRALLTSLLTSARALELSASNHCCFNDHEGCI